jgi:hypothetical protein
MDSPEEQAVESIRQELHKLYREVRLFPASKLYRCDDC